MSINIVTFDIIVIVFPVFCSRVIWWVNIDDVYLAPVRVGQRFQHMVVLAIDY